jgi:hypothetical protein
MRQPEELVSGILTVDMSDHLPIFTFMGRPMPRKKAPKLITCRSLDENKANNFIIHLNNTDWSIL